VGTGGPGQGGPVLGFDTSDLGRQEGQTTVLVAGHAGPGGAGLEFDGVGDDVGGGGQRGYCRA
jgi:hypothetical protein